MSTYKSIAVFAGLAVAVSLASGAWAAQPGATSKPAEKSWDEALNKTVSVNLENATLEDAMGYFRDTTGLNIVVRWRALEAVGLEKSVAVTVKLKDVPFGRALEATLGTVGTDNPLDYAVKDEILIVSTADDLNRMLLTRVYDVADLTDGAEPQQVDSLINTIQQSVARDSWTSLGGTQGSLTHFKGLLTVTQTYRAQVAAKALLDDLRKSGPRALASPGMQARQAELRVKLVGSMKDTCFDPQAFGIVAIGGLRTEVPQKPEELAQQLEAVLSKTKSLGLRNAIRLTLKDIYLETGAAPKAQEQLKEMIRENDEALQKAPAAAASAGPAALGGMSSYGPAPTGAYGP